MVTLQISAPPAHSARIKAGMGKDGCTMTLYFTSAAIDEHFGGEMVDRSFTIQSGFQDGQGHLRIEPDVNGASEPIRALHGSARISVARFAACLPREKTKAEACKVVEMEEDTGAVVLRLPAWASVPSVTSTQ